MGRIDANDMGYAVKNDSQFQIPKYPYFSKSFELLFFNDSIAIDGLEEIQMFKGKDSIILLPKIIKLLDGKHTISDISLITEEPFNKIFNAVALLYTRGFIQEGASNNTDIFLEKFIDQTRLNMNINEVYKKVSDSKITFYSPVSMENEYLSLNSENSNKKYEYYLFEFFSKADFESHYDKMNTLYKNNKKIFIITFNSSHTHLFFLEKNHTYSINDLINSQFFKFEKNDFDKKNLSLVRTMMESVVFNFIGSIGNFYLGNGYIYSVNNEMLTTKINRILEHSSHSYFQYIYFQLETTFNFPSKKYTSLKDHQNHYKTSNLNLAKEVKTFPSNSSINLNEINDENLIFILFQTAGLKKFKNDKRVFRNNPTGGNLGSVDLYFINKYNNNLKLNALYYYNPHLDECILIKENVEELNLNNSKYIFIFIGDYKKVMKKYNEFGYKITQLDCGVAFANLLLSTKCKKMKVQEFESPDYVKKMKSYFFEEGIVINKIVGVS
ncbi:hypothetical protein [Macrococcus equi]|uniref:hypothetical protein n=1 Tax=Macrococcus equi TaxID=3395462 RepID=UPI0039BE76E2